jgi:endonuclease-8
MGMTGSWHVYAPGERWRKPARLARLVLEVPGAVAVCFSAPVVEVRDRRDLTLGHLGPDILAPLFDVGTVIPRARLMPARAVGEVLLDQRVCAGIGNIWKCESLWRLQLDPWVRVADIDDATLLRLYLEARTLMLGSAGGRLVRHAVHGRKGRPCPRCNAAISARQQGNPPRLTYFCPRCQSTPAAPDL